MKVSWPPTVFPLLTAVAAAAFVSLDRWDQWRVGLLPALSVVAAAVLVRLARGLPFSNPDHFDPAEVVAVTEAIKSLARSLRGLIFVALTAMVSLVLASSLAAGLAKLPLLPVVIDGGHRAISGLLGLWVAYAFVRTIQVVQSDVALVDRQAKMLTDAVRRKEARAFEAGVIATATPMAKPQGYGEPLH